MHSIYCNDVAEQTNDLLHAIYSWLYYQSMFILGLLHISSVITFKYNRHFKHTYLWSHVYIGYPDSRICVNLFVTIMIKFKWARLFPSKQGLQVSRKQI